ncbi:MAG: ABC transporter substrate-binding protein, partial [Bacteroidales bacterium]|nr:ABC transporter substrate-binding protein [Bacteroidales bacterium]
MKCRFTLLLLLLLASCTSRPHAAGPGGMEYAQWFDLQGNQTIIHSPYGAAPDTLTVDGPLRSIVCMSSSYIGFLDALGCDSVVTAVSGLAYVQDPEVLEQAVDVGYDAALDYETILKLRPDLVLTYAVSAAEPPYLQKLRDLGIRTAVIHEHLESHPLARAEYIRFFGLLTGRKDLADSLFSDIRDRYLSMVKETDAPQKVLVNIPYADQWYIPGGDNYMTRLIQDAGGAVLGAVPGRFESSVIS